MLSIYCKKAPSTSTHSGYVTWDHKAIRIDRRRALIHAKFEQQRSRGTHPDPRVDGWRGKWKFRDHTVLRKLIFRDDVSLKFKYCSWKHWANVIVIINIPIPMKCWKFSPRVLVMATSPWLWWSRWWRWCETKPGSCCHVTKVVAWRLTFIT